MTTVKEDGVGHHRMDTYFDLSGEIYIVISPEKVYFQGLPLEIWSCLPLEKSQQLNHRLFLGHK